MRSLTFAVGLACVLVAAQAPAQQTFGTLVVVESEPIPSGASALSAERPAEWRLVELLYAPLFSAATAGGYEPYLGKKVTVAEGGKRLTVSLNDAAKWSVGRDVSPLDVVYTYELARRGKWNGAWKALLRPIESVKRSDDGFDVVFELKAPVKEPERLLVVPVLPSGLHGPLDDPDRQRPLPLGTVGAGPYKLAKDGDPTRLVVNEHALRKPRISEVRLVSAGSPRLAVEYTRLIGSAVTFEVPASATGTLEAEFDGKRLRTGARRLWAIGVAPKESMMRDPIVRKTVLVGLDRGELIGPTGGRPTAAPMAASAPGYPAAHRPKPGDAVEAEATLWWNGWQREPHQPYFLRTADVVDSREQAFLPLLVDMDDESALRMAMQLRRRFALIGIRLELDPRPRLEFSSRLRSREYPMALFSVPIMNPRQPSAAEIARLFHSQGADNVLPGTDAELDKLLDAGDVAGAIARLAGSERAIFLGLDGGPAGVVARNVTAPVVRGRGGLERIDKWRVR